MSIHQDGKNLEKRLGDLVFSAAEISSIIQSMGGRVILPNGMGMLLKRRGVAVHKLYSSGSNFYRGSDVVAFLRGQENDLRIGGIVPDDPQRLQRLLEGNPAKFKDDVDYRRFRAEQDQPPYFDDVAKICEGR